MAEIRANGVAGALTAGMNNTTDTSMSSGGLADLPAVSSPDVAKITLFKTDGDGRVTQQEIVYVTAHTASATSATVSRAQEGTSKQTWASGDKWVHAPTAADVTAPLASKTYNPTTATTIQTTSTTPVSADTTNLAVTFTVPASGSVMVKLTGACIMQTAGTAGGYWAVRSGGALVGAMQMVTESATPSRPIAFIPLTGLTAGSSYTVEWAHCTGSSGTYLNLLIGGGSGGTVVGGYGAATMEVWSA